MKFTKSLIFCFLTVLLSVGAWAQNSTVSGKVTDEKGLPMPGVSVVVKGTTNGTTSDFDGKYDIKAPKNGTLVFSFVGYNNVTESINSRSTINVKLTGKAEDLKEVVVTALGVKRQSRALGYATQNVEGKTMQTVKGIDVATSLSGKVAGMAVYNSTEFAAAPEIELRGEKGVLLVIDGVPFDNMTLKEVPADDIETISVLKGATAAALYGQRGQKGAIMVTTKKGTSSNGLTVVFNSSNMYAAGYLAIPEMQSTYGRLIDPTTNRVSTSGDGSWGAPLDGRLAEQWDPVSKSWVTKPYLPIGKDNFKNFIQQGYVFNNNVSITQQSDLGSLRASATWVKNQGQYPNSNYDKITYSIGGEMKINNFSLSSTFSYNKQSSPNIGFSGYTAYDPMYNLLVWSSPDYDVRQLKDYWIVKDEVQNTSYTNTNNNPYFDQNERTHSINRDVMNGMLALNYNFTPWLKGTFRTGYDLLSDRQVVRVSMGSLRSAGTADVIEGAWGLWGESQKGSYNEGLNRKFSSNNDLLLTANKTFGKFTVEAFGGVSFYYSQREGLAAYTNGGLSTPGYYSLNASALPAIVNASTSKKQMNSAFGRLTLSWNKTLYVEATDRNDWSSTLSANTRSYNYPSLAGSFVISELLPVNDILSFWKIRSSWTTTKESPGAYAINNTFGVTNSAWGTLSSEALSNTIRSSNIAPYETESYEYGTAISFLKRRLNFDFTYYTKRKFNRIIYDNPVSSTTGYDFALINSKEEITRKGFELSANVVAIKNESWQWDIGANWSSAADYYTQLDPIYSADKPWIKVGERADPFVIREYLRDPQGNIIHGAGKPLYSNYDSVIGYSGAKFIWGLNTTLKYKNFQFNMSVDGRVGGMTQTVTEMYMWQTGNHPDSLDPARYLDATAGGTNYIGQGVKVVSGAATYDAYGNITSDNRVYAPNDVPITYQSYIETLHKGTAWGGAPSELESYSTTFFKIREMSLTYDFSKSMNSALHSKAFSISAIGQNLLLVAKQFKYSDPDGGYENFSDPSIRYVGVSLKATY